jgi:hypothetical protein
MHDPMTVAFQLPFGITIWHVDPERGGDDDSCDWFGNHRPLTEREEGVRQCVENMETLLDNRPHFPDSPEHLEFQHLKAAVSVWRRRGVRLPVRWHFWHWRFQIAGLLNLKRFLFSRCAGCGRRFSWGYAPLSTSWGGDGPRWFRGEPHTYHFGCDPSRTFVAEDP